MQYIEVEQKFRLLSEPDDFKAALTARGATSGAPTRQVDSYYNAPHRDFLAAPSISEWLRVRVEDDQASLNFKRWHPLDEKIKTHCDEFETVVADAEAVRRTLAALDFTPLTEVDKVREEWHLDDIAVAFDTVAGLGTFVEFEFKGEADTIEQATDRIQKFIDGLDIKLGDRIHAGYPHMALGIDPR
ncbi:class IV adenylate cyclase [Actinacidiphila sp. DG2A-62]|uniref:class IV adenylate cyclase n=1 Tax=Actinacidiphila sp. DG2A-62 TaxID=3108821 RepID=UPI002DB7AB51|nr:class IV adenylate cyclase [Actinacidiphila sp. DG2A-62]MEC3995128.1 class IV adenylate cyclase [Actinacidiphila sp. DG2A-62]